MTIKIYGNQGPGPISDPKKTDGPRGAKKSGPTQQATDKVDFSSVLNGVSRAKAPNATVETARTEKVQALKEQVAEGSYQPDLNKVAASLLRFLVEEK